MSALEDEVHARVQLVDAINRAEAAEKQNEHYKKMFEAFIALVGTKEDAK